MRAARWSAAWGLLALVGAAAPVWAQEPDSFELDDTDVEAAEPVAAEAEAPPAVDAESEQPLWVRVLGHFHSAAVHLPIAWLLLLLLVDVLNFGLGHGQLARPGYLLLWLTVLSFLPAMATGLLRLEVLGLSGPDLEPALVHRNLIWVAFALLVTALLLRGRKRGHLAGGALSLYLAAVVAAVGITVVAGYIGGNMVFGSLPGLSD